ncbi:Permease of the drug/metabolite transporter (DMT) superfamily [Pseudarcicella hirudinis]|uniref:Permease of the drug/metabolite transporter (DMT) superfamily n=3 Tax=Pseudarcicella hirudinis TaxID=1079859 RepID=A0A1I5SXC5_9BACT|nr:Permease of the drug/metabolite transporter (DMT) superfamily [Pseudarcicella hirudinis]
MFNSKESAIPVKAYLFLALGIGCITFSSIFVKLAHAPALTSGFYSYLFCFIGLLPIWIVKKIKIPDRNTLLLVILGGTFFACDMALWNLSIIRTSASVSTLLANNASIFVGIGSLIFFNQKLPLKYWIGLFVALGGILLVVGKDFMHNQGLGLGHLMAIGAAFFYALYMLVTQKARLSLDTVNFMGWSLIPSLIISFVLCLVNKDPMTGFDQQTWILMIAMGIICHLAGWLSINYALGHISAAIVSPTLLFQPVMTAVISFFILQESLRTEQIIGGLIVIAGIYLVNQKNKAGKSNLKTVSDKTLSQ